MGKTLYTRIKEQFDADPEALPAEVARHCNTGLGLVLSIRAQLARDRQDRPEPEESVLVPPLDGNVVVDGRDLETDVHWHKLPTPAAFVEITPEALEQVLDDTVAGAAHVSLGPTGPEGTPFSEAPSSEDGDAMADLNQLIASNAELLADLGQRLDDMKPGQRDTAQLTLDPRVAAQVITEAPAGSYVAKSPGLREFAATKVAILPALPNVGGQGDGMKDGEARLTLDPTPVAVVDLSALQAAIARDPEPAGEDDRLGRQELLELVARLTAENLRLRRK